MAYAVLAAIWAFCITGSMEPLGAGGKQSLRDLHRYLVPLLVPAGLLVVCALTPVASRAGTIARWLAMLSRSEAHV